MGKIRHHYVPRFYLKAFRSSDRRINVFNIDSSRAFFDVGLKDQCYKRRFYGTDDDLENRISRVEGFIATAFETVRVHRALPSTPEGRLAVLAGVALQLQRTRAMAHRIGEATRLFNHQLGDEAVERLGLPRLAESGAVGASLSILPEILLGIDDLYMRLVASPRSRFVAGDDPAVTYNQWCEDITYCGVTGALQAGLQIFLPLSPGLLLLLFDNTIYKVKPGSGIVMANDDDVHSMNLLQVVSASENVYFAEARHEGALRDLAERARRHRLSSKAVVREYGEDDGSSSLIHQYLPMACLGLRLSFLEVRRNARRMPLAERGRRYRKDLPLAQGPTSPWLQGRSATFTRPVAPRGGEVE